MTVRLVPEFQRGARVDIVFNAPVVVLVEGNDEAVLVSHLLGHRKEDILIYDMRGKDNWGGKLNVVVDFTFRQSVRNLGLIRDAESDANATFQSCCSVLAKHQLPQPRAAGRVAKVRGMKIGVFLLPDNAEAGMLEDLMLRGGEPSRTEAAKQHLDDLSVRGLDGPRIRQKGLLQSYLAGTVHSPKTLTVALEKSVFDLELPVFDHLRQFVEELAVLDPGEAGPIPGG